jgi:hypothetical protein
MKHESPQGIWREEQILEGKLWQILEYISLNEKTSKISLNPKIRILKIPQKRNHHFVSRLTTNTLSISKKSLLEMNLILPS